MMTTSKAVSLPVWCGISQGVVAAVALVGIGVLAGWHLHLRVLVQILPGVIPMQYNTALCFIVLGASGLLLVSNRVHLFLTAFGGAFLLVMGILVIYEYSAGISLGVDTLFYPWDLTLSAFVYGGVMIGYEWQQSPPTDQGMPNWAPGSVF